MPRAKKVKIETREDMAGLWVVLVQGEDEFLLTPQPFTLAGHKETVKRLLKALNSKAA